MLKFFAPIIIIGVSIAMYFMYITPMTSEVKALTKKNTEYIDVLDKAKELIAKRDEILAEYNSIPESDTKRLEKVIPNKFDPVFFVNYLSGKTSQYGLVMSDFLSRGDVNNNRNDVADPTSILPYKVNNVSFKVTGQYSDFLSFLSSLELDLRLVDVVGLSITQGDEKKGTMVFSLEINTYSLQ